MTTETQPASGSKALYWTGWVLTILPSLLLLMSAVMKFVKPQPVQEGFPKMGLSLDLATPIGVTELICTILYLIPQTTVLGAILLTGYLGGATLAHLRIGEPFIMPPIMGAVIWLGIFLRDARLRALLPLRR